MLRSNTLHSAKTTRRRPLGWKRQDWDNRRLKGLQNAFGEGSPPPSQYQWYRIVCLRRGIGGCVNDETAEFPVSHCNSLQLYNPHDCVFLDTSLIPSKSPSPDISTPTVNRQRTPLTSFSHNNLLSTAKMPRNTSSTPPTAFWTCHNCLQEWVYSTTPSCINCHHQRCSSCTNDYHQSQG